MTTENVTAAVAGLFQRQTICQAVHRVTLLAVSKISGREIIELYSLETAYSFGIMLCLNANSLIQWRRN